MSDSAVIVAGGLGAIGGAITRRLRADAVRVVAWGRRQEGSPEVQRRLADLRHPEYVCCDVSDSMAVRRAAEQAGEIRDVVYAAGVTHPGPPFDTTQDQVTAMIGANLAGAIHVGMAAGGLMAKQGTGGTLLYLGSWAAHVPDPSDLVYGATKAGAEAYFRGLALVLGAAGVRALTLSVGVVAEHGMAARHMLSDPRGYGERVRGVPLRRFATVDEVADTVLWLISDRAAYLTGTTITLDGGASLRPGP